MATAVAEQTEKREKTEPTPPATPDPDLYPYILKLVERLAPAERLQLVADIVRTVQPFVGEPVDDLHSKSALGNPENRTYILKSSIWLMRKSQKTLLCPW